MHTHLPVKTRQTERPIAALLADLKQRGLLDETLVIWGGEFGRTPNVNKQVGRDHWPRVSFEAAVRVLAPQGPYNHHSVGPNRPRVGRPRAAETCIRPESLPTNRSARSMAAAEASMSPLPTKSIPRSPAASRAGVAGGRSPEGVRSIKEKR